MVEYNALRFRIWDAEQVGITVYTADPIDIFFVTFHKHNYDKMI